jgi:hypothetical protein
MLLRNLHARHCLADGSNELQCPQRKNVGTEQVNETYQKYENEFIDVLNKHAPLKSWYLINRSFVCKAKEGRHFIINNKFYK